MDTNEGPAPTTSVGCGDSLRRGRPRCPVAHGAILEAAADLLAATGYAALTIEAVAARAGVGKATVYRRWPDKSALLRDAVTARVCAAGGPPEWEETGEGIRADLRRHVRIVAVFLTGPAGTLLAALAGGGGAEAAPHNSPLCPLFSWRGAVACALRTAQAQGALRPTVDIEAALDALYGPLYYRWLARHACPDEAAFLEAVTEAVWAGFLRP